jgi:hypothetical protein
LGRQGRRTWDTGADLGNSFGHMRPSRTPCVFQAVTNSPCLRISNRLMHPTKDTPPPMRSPVSRAVLGPFLHLPRRHPVAWAKNLPS